MSLVHAKADAFDRIFDILFLDIAEDDTPFINPDKEWDDALELIADEIRAVRDPDLETPDHKDT